MNDQRQDAVRKIWIPGIDPTSLVDSETNIQSLLETTDSQESIHRSTQVHRERLIEAFARHGADGFMKRANRLSDCCKWPILFVKSDGQPGLSLQRCRDRLCPVCSRIKGIQTEARIKEAVQRMNSVRFFTLTIQSHGKTLNEAERDLRNGFREIRRLKAWKKYVVAGIWTVEIKRGETPGTWNCHIHMLADGKYFPQSELSDAWKQATGDSFIVDIRKVQSVDKAASYVTKYIAKPGDFRSMSDEDLIEFAKAVKGKRMFGTFGKLHGMKLEETEETEVNLTETASISANKLTHLEADGYQPAIEACQILQRCGGYWASSIGRRRLETDAKITDKDRINLGLCLVLCSAFVDSQAVAKPPPAQIEPQEPSQTEMYIQAMLVDEWLYAPLR